MHRRKLSACTTSKESKALLAKENSRASVAAGLACSTKNIAELVASTNENQLNGKVHSLSTSMDDVLLRSSTGSNDTMCTSYTEVRDRASTCTVVKSSEL